MPSEITLAEEFFSKEKNIALDAKVKVLYGTDEDDVISLYVTFTKVYDEQRKLYGRTREAILETIRICKDKNVLKEYLESREEEVVNRLMTLFDEEQIMKNHDAALTREITEREQEKAAKDTVESIKNVMNKLAYTTEQAMELLCIPEDRWDYFKAML